MSGAGFETGTYHSWLVRLAGQDTFTALSQITLCARLTWNSSYTLNNLGFYLTKRSFKNFTTERWNESLKNQNWDPVINEQDLDVKVSMFTEIINKALDDVAPLKTFIVKSHYKFGISEEIKLIMKKEILNVYNSTGWL